MVKSKTNPKVKIKYNTARNKCFGLSSIVSNTSSGSVDNFGLASTWGTRGFRSLASSAHRMLGEGTSGRIAQVRYVEIPWKHEWLSLARMQKIFFAQVQKIASLVERLVCTERRRTRGQWPIDGVARNIPCVVRK